MQSVRDVLRQICVRGDFRRKLFDAIRAGCAEAKAPLELPRDRPPMQSVRDVLRQSNRDFRAILGDAMQSVRDVLRQSLSWRLISASAA